MKNKGFSLIELLVAMTIMLLLLMMTTYTFQRITHRAKDSTSAISTGSEQLSAFELLRLDLEHAGFGLAEKINGVPSDIMPVRWDDSKRLLTVASSLKNTDPSTFGWALATCGSNDVDVDNRKTADQNLLWIDANGNYIGLGTTPPSCPAGEEELALIGYPYSETLVGTKQPYSTIEYSLSSDDQKLEICNPKTYNLLRTTNGDATGTIAVYNCIADMTADLVLRDASMSTVEEVRENLISTDIYILAQVGKKDPTYRFSGYESFDPFTGVMKFSIDEATDPIDFKTKFRDEEEFINYRWKVIKLSAPLQGI